MMPRNVCSQLAVLAVAVVFSTLAQAQTTPVSITGNYFENFDSMGLSSLYPPGWTGFKTSGNSVLPPGTVILPTGIDGSGGTGSTYHFGSSGSGDRALGSIADSQTVAGFGLVLVNNTGRTLTAADVLISFREEQWRTGSASNTDEVWTFEYRTGGPLLDVNDPSSVGWTQVAALDLHEIQTGSAGASTALDGNATGNFANISGTLAGLVWNPGDRLVIRWLDNNDPGNDAGMAIDNLFMFVSVPEPSGLLLCGMAAAALRGLLRVGRRI